MKWACVLALVSACKRERSPVTVATGSESVPAVAAPPDAAAIDGAPPDAAPRLRVSDDVAREWVESCRPAERQRRLQARQRECDKLKVPAKRLACELDDGCFVETTPIENVTQPWSDPTLTCATGKGVYDPASCILEVSVGGRTVIVDAMRREMQYQDPRPLTLDTVGIIEHVDGPPGELELHYTVTIGEEESEQEDRVVVCRAVPQLACTEPMDEAELEEPLRFK